MSRLRALTQDLKKAKDIATQDVQPDQVVAEEEVVEGRTKSVDHANRVRHTLYLPKDLSYKIRIEKVETGLDMSEIVTKACQLYFELKDEGKI